MTTVGYRHTPETRAKMSSASRRRWADPSEHEKMSAARRGELGPGWYDKQAANKRREVA